jgi:hypothetical protein
VLQDDEVEVVAMMPADEVRQESRAYHAG